MEITLALPQLLKVADEPDRMELQIMQTAIETTRSAYQSAATAANKKDWDVAREGLQEASDRLWSRYMVQEERFKNCKAVLDHLNETGYSISQGKLYAAAKSGKLKLQADKSVLKSSVEAYINHPDSKLIKHAETGETIEDAALARKERLQRIAIGEQKLIKVKAEARKEDGSWMSKADAWLAITEFIGLVMSRLERQAYKQTPRYIQLCGGQQEREAELVAAITADNIELFNQLAATEEFEVMFDDAEDED